MKSSTIPPHEAHLYTTRAESGLIWTGFLSAVFLAYYLGLAVFADGWVLALPLLVIAAVLGSVAGVLYYVCRAQRMYLQPGSPDYVGKPLETSSSSD